MLFRTLLLSGATLLSIPAFAEDAPAPQQPPAAATAPTSPVPKDIVVTGRLDAARASIQPSLGATTYSISNATIQALPGGDNQQLNQILLQLPGVSQDGAGQLHVRDDHANLQYRINGTILPEGIAVFGQTLSPRLVDRFDLRTGALPAQYGLRTAGIIDITTKSGFENGGELSLYGGSRGTIEPSVEYGGKTGSTNYFVTASYRHNDLGIESVDGSTDALHDQTNQYQGFVYLDHTIDDGNRVSLIGGYSDQRFQIPNPRGLHPDAGYSVGGVSDFLSDDLDERQHERTAFGILSLLHDAGPVTLQGSLFARYSSLQYTPDVLGELLFNGIAQAAKKQDFTTGIQMEGVYRLSGAHTLRGGFVITRDHGISRTTTQVFPVDAQGAQTGQPIAIADNGSATEMTYSVYLQDEWQPIDHITINFGGRFDHYDGYRSEQQFSPRVNAVWAPGGGFTIHGGYARYFSPAPFANVATTTIAKFVGSSAEAPGSFGDVPFAERQDYFDIGAEQKIGPVTIGVDGYHRRSRNLLDEGQFGAPIILTPFNYRHGRIDGIEGNVSYTHHGWLVYGNIAHAEAKGTDISSGQFNFDPADLATISRQYIYLDHDQTWTGSGGASYRFDRGFLHDSKLAASMIYGSGLRRDGAVPNGGKLPGYAVFNISASHKFTGPGIEVRADVFNLFDHVYEIRDGSGVGVGAPQYGQRRGFFFGISKSI
ncbi:TonB-dependent receptor [Sphingomonas sp. GC_Shp_3]|uniref:TonB-dependent receptor n=1 Tax=Sphingomonas sp. GC_Shp_3 TaxID=2937383 RepID=UPI00226A17A1|nr:TonB-dependent receptor [Sphingomonas sp. GC_Shp_3]